MSLSLAEQIAQLPEDERAEILDSLDADELLHDADFWLRPEQKPPDTHWSVFLALAGRGWGKSKSAAEFARKKARENPGSRGGLVARTAADVRDVVVGGESGILNVCPPSERPEYKKASRQLVWPNGSTALLFSSEEPDQLRGPQFHWSVADELAAWRQIPDDSGLTAWENLRLATRLGAHPQIFGATTPKRIPLLRDLLDEADSHPGRIVVVRGRTRDNTSLSASYIDVIEGKYAGTTMGRQELDGELLDAIEGALWSEDMIKLGRVPRLPQMPPVRVVAVDPSVAENPHDECGIVVVGSTSHKQKFRRHAWVLEDATVKGSPGVWAKRVIEMARKWQAPIVAESNQGHALVTAALQTVAPDVRVYLVHSKQGKALRADAVIGPYEQGRVHHVGYFADLEDQMETWEPERSRKSPDRVDALVHGLTALLIKSPKGFYAGPGYVRAKSLAQRKLPNARSSAGARIPTRSLKRS